MTMKVAMVTGQLCTAGESAEELALLGGCAPGIGLWLDQLCIHLDHTTSMVRIQTLCSP